MNLIYQKGGKPKDGFKKWKADLPPNLRATDPKDYDLRGAYEAGLEPELYDDGSYHLGSRDPRTGRIFKDIQHPTIGLALEGDRNMGYIPYLVGDKAYTNLPEDITENIGGSYILPEVKIKPKMGLIYKTGGKMKKSRLSYREWLKSLPAGFKMKKEGLHRLYMAGIDPQPYGDENGNADE